MPTNRNPEHIFLGRIGSWHAQDGAEESLNLYFDLDRWEYLISAVRFPDGGRETIYGIRSFLRRVPDAEPVVRRLLLDKFRPEVYRPQPTPVEDCETIN